MVVAKSRLGCHGLRVPMHYLSMGFSPKPPEDELPFLDKGTAPLLGWALDSAGSFKEDEEGNRYLLVAIDPFSKWVEVRPVPSLHSWRTAEFLYDICNRWGKPSYVRTNNGPEY